MFADGFHSPILLTNAGDGSNLMYVVEQGGVVQILHVDGTVEPKPFMDISERIAAGGERGLLGLAFHPQYAENGRFFVNYTDLSGNTVVSEFQRSTARAGDPKSENILFEVTQPFGNHNGGMVAFGPDSALYVGMGDGGSGGDPQGNGQNLHALLGKMLRIDVDAADPQPAIWDSGMRNPWRYSFDRETGDLWIGDVGQGAWEEIDAEPAGQGGRNYGWNIMEGPACYGATDCDKTGLTLPVASYGHAGGGCAVIGGYVYRGTAYPDLVGTYLYSDLCNGNIWGLDAASALAGAGVRPVKLGSMGQAVSSFGEDEAGELYILGYGGRVVSIKAM